MSQTQMLNVFIAVEELDDDLQVKKSKELLVFLNRF